MQSNEQLTPQDGTWQKKVHTFAQWLLEKIKAHDTNSWTAGTATGYEVGHKEGKKLGHEEGRDEGHKEGRKLGYGQGLAEGHEDGFADGSGVGQKLGYEQGYEAGKLVLELKPGARPTDVAPGVDT